MNEKFNVKIVRFKTGEDIICFCFEDYKLNKIVIKYPKTFYKYIDVESNETELLLEDWMNQEAFAYQEIVVSLDEVLFTTYSNVLFGYKYLASVSEELEQDDEELAARVKETIESLTAPKEETIH